MSQLFPSFDRSEQTHSKNLSMKALLIAPALRNYIITVFSVGTALGMGISHGLNKITFYLEQEPVRLFQYEQVKLEMSLAQVESILGSGTEIAQFDSVTIYEWDNPDGSFTTLFFQDGYLVGKEQTDLT